MQSNAAKAKKHRERAAQLREILEDVRSAKDRKTLSDIAKEYDKAAKSLEVAR